MDCDEIRKFGRDCHLPTLSVVCLEYGTAGRYLEAATLEATRRSHETHPGLASQLCIQPHFGW